MVGEIRPVLGSAVSNGPLTVLRLCSAESPFCGTSTATATVATPSPLVLETLAFLLVPQAFGANLCY